jgi:hypothetical protein
LTGNAYTHSSIVYDVYNTIGNCHTQFAGVLFIPIAISATINPTVRDIAIYCGKSIADISIILFHSVIPVEELSSIRFT